MMNQEQLVKALKALSNENRLKILEAIRNYQMRFCCAPQNLESLEVKDGATCCVDEIGQQFEIAQSTISQHLKELHGAGILDRHKRAKWVYYTINPKTMEELVKYLNQFASDLVAKR